LIQIPHEYFEKTCRTCGFDLPAAGDYGTGLVFLPHDAVLRTSMQRKMSNIIKNEGQVLLGWRDVPLNPADLGTTARDSMPFICQVFIGRNGVECGIEFERKLYLIRRQAEKAIKEKHPDDTFFIATLSSRVIVYKGMLTAEQLGKFYSDLNDEDILTSLALVHSRYSTNTFPSWERAHPNRWIIHNGEINTLRGNINAMHAREPVFKSGAFGEDLKKLLPIINQEGSDSAVFDNCFEFFMLSGMPIENVMMMMIPEPGRRIHQWIRTKKPLRVQFLPYGAWTGRQQLDLQTGSASVPFLTVNVSGPQILRYIRQYRRSGLRGRRS
jgi:glutamate synthase (ferredoxin)